MFSKIGGKNLPTIATRVVTVTVVSNSGIVVVNPQQKFGEKSDKMPSHVVRFVYLKGIITNFARFRNRHLDCFHPLKVLNLKPSGHRFTEIQYFFSSVKASNFAANFTASQICELFEFTLLPKSNSSWLRTGRAPKISISSNHPFSVASKPSSKA